MYITFGFTSEMSLTSSTIPWDAVSAIATSVAALGVVFALWQIRLTRSIAQLQFEDALAREYRDLCTTIPAAVFLNGPFTEDDYQNSFDEFYRYIDLSNEQISLRQRGRISKDVWSSWCIGIEQNLALPAFARAWQEVKERTQSFNELRALEAEGFKADPKCWPKPK
ncbi:MAG TPA: hypothetical protein VF811_06130 [Parasulfuritortus sp.]